MAVPQPLTPMKAVVNCRMEDTIDSEYREFAVPKRSIIPPLDKGKGAKRLRGGGPPTIHSNLTFPSLSPSQAALLQLTWSFEMRRDNIEVRVVCGSSDFQHMKGRCSLEFRSKTVAVGPSYTYRPPLSMSFMSRESWVDNKREAEGRGECRFIWGQNVPDCMPKWTDYIKAIRVELRLEFFAGRKVETGDGVRVRGDLMPFWVVPAYETFFMSDFLSDFWVSCGTERWPAHRVVLAAGSEFFKGMFQSGMKEALAGQIVIPDVDPKAVRQMLEYLYKGVCQLEGLNYETLLKLFKLAHMYQIEGLRLMTEKKILGLITVENAPEIHTLAERYGITCAMEKAWSVAKSNRERVSKNPEHLKQLVDSFPSFMYKLISNV